MPTLQQPQPISFSIQKKSLVVGNDSVIQTSRCSPQTKKTSSPSFTQSLLSLVLLVSLFGNFARTNHNGLGRIIQTVSQGNTINYYYDPQVEFLELGHSVNGSHTWNLYGPDRSGTYGGAQGIGGLEAEYQETTGFFCNAINNYFGDIVGIVAPTYHSPALYPGVVGGYGPMPGSDVNHDLEPQWQGHYLDATGLYYMGARYYDPQSGRFLSPDPLGHSSSMDLYSYCNGDPVNGLDPDGRCVEGYSAGKNGIIPAGAPNSSGFHFGMMAGAITSEISNPEGIIGAENIILNTASFGGTDKLGWTYSNDYQGPEYEGSRAFAKIGVGAGYAAAAIATGGALVEAGAAIDGKLIGNNFPTKIGAGSTI